MTKISRRPEVNKAFKGFNFLSCSQTVNNRTETDRLKSKPVFNLKPVLGFSSRWSRNIVEDSEDFQNMGKTDHNQHQILLIKVIIVQSPGSPVKSPLPTPLSKRTASYNNKHSFLRYSQKETPGLFSWEFSCNQLAHRESIACNWL